MTVEVRLVVEWRECNGGSGTMVVVMVVVVMAVVRIAVVGMVVMG